MADAVGISSTVIVEVIRAGPNYYALILFGLFLCSLGYFAYSLLKKPDNYFINKEEQQ